MDRYMFKTNAIEKIWFLLNKGAKKEVKRAIAIWASKVNFNEQKIKKLRAMIISRNKDKMRKALLRWQTWSNFIEHQCRVKLLQIECSQKLFLSQVFHQARVVLRNEKRLRQRTLNSYLKAWRDHVHYNRHLMQTNMAAIHFGQTNQRYLMKTVFDELR